MADIQLRTRKDSNRADDHSVHSLDRFVFTVPDLDEAAHFYDAFGLQVERSEGRLDLHTVGHPHAWGSLFPASGPKKLQYLRFGCFAEDLAAILATGMSTLDENGKAGQHHARSRFALLKAIQTVFRSVPLKRVRAAELRTD